MNNWLIGISYLFCFSILAESSTWTGGAYPNTDWQTPGNWSNGVPGISDPDLAANFGYLPSGPDLVFVNLINPVTLNTIKTNDQSCTFSGTPLCLGGGSFLVDVSLTNAVNIFNNPLNITGTGSITIDNISSLQINNSLNCSNNSNIKIANGEQLFLCNSGNFTDSQFSYSCLVKSVRASFFTEITSQKSKLTFTGGDLSSIITFGSVDVNGESNFLVVNANSQIKSLLSDNSIVSFKSTEGEISSCSLARNSTLSLIGTTNKSSMSYKPSMKVEFTSSDNSNVIVSDLAILNCGGTFKNGSTLLLNQGILNCGLYKETLNLTDSNMNIINSSSCVIYSSLNTDANSTISVEGSQLQFLGYIASENAESKISSCSLTRNSTLSIIPGPSIKPLITIETVSCDSSNIAISNSAVLNCSGTFKNGSNISVNRGILNCGQQGGNLSLIGSTMNMSDFSSCSIYSALNTDANSTITLDNSQLQLFANNTFSPSNVSFFLDQSCDGMFYIQSNVGSIDLVNSKNTVGCGDSFTRTCTFYLYGIQEAVSNPSPISQISNFDASLFNITSSGNVVLHLNKNIQKITNNSYPDFYFNAVAVTADVAHSQAATIASQFSSSSQITLAVAKQLENSRQNARQGDQTYLALNRNESRDPYLVENSSFIAQATPVEQLSERGVYRPNREWSFYIAPAGSFGSTKTKRTQLGSEYWTAGFFAGFDWISSYECHPERDFAFGIGSMINYTYFHSKADHHAGSINVNRTFANIYGTAFSRRLEELSFNFSWGAGYNTHDIKRTTGHFSSLVARSSTGGWETGGNVGIEYLFSNARFCKMGNFRFMPMFYLQYNMVSINDYKEHGSGEFDLRVHSDALQSLRSFLGARANYLYRASSNLTFRPELTFGWQREYLLDDQCIQFSTISAPNAAYACATIAPHKDTFIVGADMNVRIHQSISIELNYQLSYNNLLFDNNLYLQWKLEF